MSRSRTVCQHPQAIEINAELSLGATLHSVAEQFSISRSATHRHKVRCPALLLTAKPRVALGAEVREGVGRAQAIAALDGEVIRHDRLTLSGLLDYLERGLDRLDAAADDAAEKGPAIPLKTISG
jgi:hypothetical protein